MGTVTYKTRAANPSTCPTSQQPAPYSVLPKPSGRAPHPVYPFRLRSPFLFTLPLLFLFLPKGKIFSTSPLWSSRPSRLVAVPSLCLLQTPGSPPRGRFPRRPQRRHTPSIDGPDGRAGPGRATPSQGRAGPTGAPKAPLLPAAPAAPCAPRRAPSPAQRLTCRINAAAQPPRSSSPAGGCLGSSGTRSPRHPQAAPQTRQLGRRPARPTPTADPRGPPSFAGGGSPRSRPGRRPLFPGLLRNRGRGPGTAGAPSGLNAPGRSRGSLAPRARPSLGRRSAVAPGPAFGRRAGRDGVPARGGSASSSACAGPRGRGRTRRAGPAESAGAPLPRIANKASHWLAASGSETEGGAGAPTQAKQSAARGG